MVRIRLMLRLLTVSICALLGGCTLYTSCPTGSESNGTSCVPVATGTAGSGSVGGGSNSDAGKSNIAGSAPTEPWVDATGGLVGMKTGFGNVCYLSARPGEDQLIAGLADVGLWASVDGAETWEAMGTGKGSVAITNRTSTLVYDPDHSDVFWNAGTYGAGVFKTTDAGNTFTRLGNTDHNEHLAVDFSDPKRRTLLAAGHEQGRILWLSTDGGSTWTDIGGTLPSDAAACSFPVIIDTETFLVTCSQYNVSQPSGIGLFRSTDAGERWEPVFSRAAWWPALQASDGAIYWSAEGGGALFRSLDQGLSWTAVFSGDAQSVAPIELPSGNIVTATRDYLIASADQGAHWRPVSSRLPFVPVGIVYSPFQKAFFIWTITTEVEIPAGVIQRVDFDDSAG